MNLISASHTNFPNVHSGRIHPVKFGLWLGIATLVMMFAGLTSAYIVRKAAGNWVDFRLPMYFFLSGGIMLLSSLTIHLAKRSFQKENLDKYRLFLGTTLILSFGFLVSQYLGWLKLQEIGIYLSGNPSGSFVYVISYLHVIHVVGGILFLLIAFLKSYLVLGNPANFLIYTTDSNKKIGIELLATYWHFVDLLWIYLVIFFLII